jgi:hypothetical protein
MEEIKVEIEKTNLVTLQAGEIADVSCGAQSDFVDIMW